MRGQDPQVEPAATGGLAAGTALDPSVDAERRAAIRKLGRLAAYTAPALLATMTAAKAQSASFCRANPNDSRCNLT